MLVTDYDTVPERSTLSIQVGWDHEMLFYVVLVLAYIYLVSYRTGSQILGQGFRRNAFKLFVCSPYLLRRGPVP